MKTYKLLEKCLEVLSPDGRESDNLTVFSCNTIYTVVALAKSTKVRPNHPWVRKVEDFLEELGVDISEPDFKEFPQGPKRQQARALWLTWAALMAKEWGE